MSKDALLNCRGLIYSKYSLRPANIMSVLKDLIHPDCLWYFSVLQWELSVEAFCKEDSSVKDRLYSCCRQTGVDRLNCFHNDASNPSYGPTEELPVSVPLPPSTVDFNFNLNTCRRYAGTLMKWAPIKMLIFSVINIQNSIVIAQVLHFF